MILRLRTTFAQVISRRYQNNSSAGESAIYHAAQGLFQHFNVKTRSIRGTHRHASCGRRLIGVETGDRLRAGSRRPASIYGQLSEPASNQPSARVI